MLTIYMRCKGTGMRIGTGLFPECAVDLELPGNDDIVLLICRRNLPNYIGTTSNFGTTGVRA